MFICTVGTVGVHVIQTSNFIRLVVKQRTGNKEEVEGVGPLRPSDLPSAHMTPDLCRHTPGVLHFLAINVAKQLASLAAG